MNGLTSWPERPDTRYSSDRPTAADCYKPPAPGPDGECGHCNGTGVIVGPPNYWGVSDDWPCEQCDETGRAA